MDNLRRGLAHQRRAGGLGGAWHPRPHLEPVDLPEGDQLRHRLRRAVRRPRAAVAPSVTDAYWDLVTTDIRGALDLLRPVYDESDGVDGYVSVEVAPDLARDSAGTEAAARQLHEAIAEPNLYVKIPGTAEGIAPIRSDDRRGTQHQRHAHLQPRPVRRGDGGLPLRPGAGRGRPEPHLQRRQLLHLARRHRGRSPPGRRSAPRRRSRCGARPPWPRRRSPTSGSSPPSAVRGGRRWSPGALGCSVRCGPPPPPRTPPTRTPPTSIRSSVRTR